MRLINKINILHNVIITPEVNFVKLKTSQNMQFLSFRRFKQFKRIFDQALGKSKPAKKRKQENNVKRSVGERIDDQKVAYPHEKCKKKVENMACVRL